MAGELIWELPSNSGWYHLSCNFVERFGGDKVVVGLECRGMCFDRTCHWHEGGYEKAELIDDYLVKLSRVVVPIDRLVSMQSSLDSWLREPKELSVELSSDVMDVRYCLRANGAGVFSMQETGLQIFIHCESVECSC